MKQVHSRILTVILALAVLTGIGLVAYGFLGGTKSEARQAPVPEVLFNADDPDTYVPKVEAFEPRLTGPMVRIPSLALEAELTQTGAKNGYLELPNPPKATWYNKTAMLGAEEGRSLIASHVDFGQGDAAPFSKLHRIEKGAPIQVRDLDGTLRNYKATSINLYERQELPKDVFRTTGKHELVLVTCSGPTINAGEASYYLYNLVVIAEPILTVATPPMNGFPTGLGSGSARGSRTPN